MVMCMHTGRLLASVALSSTMAIDRLVSSFWHELWCLMRPGECLLCGYAVSTCPVELVVEVLQCVTVCGGIVVGEGTDERTCSGQFHLQLV